jgi:hypothetical protein
MSAASALVCTIPSWIAVARWLPCGSAQEERTTMKSAVVLVALMVLSLSTAHAQSGVDFTPYGPGGVQWKVTRPAFTPSPANYGTLYSDSWAISENQLPAWGCNWSPYLAVGHASGRATFIPEMMVNYWKQISASDYNTMTTFTVATFLINIYRNGKVTTSYRPFTTANLNRRSYLDFGDGRYFISGSTQNSATGTSTLSYNFDVQQDDQIQVGTCSVADVLAWTQTSYILQTIPYDR